MSILIQLQSLSKRKYIPLIFVGFLILSSFFIGKAFGVEPKSQQNQPQKQVQTLG